MRLRTATAPSAAERLHSAVVNDVHSRLNCTRVQHVVAIDSVETLQRVVRDAAQAG
jgi:hypothetical protein